MILVQASDLTYGSGTKTGLPKPLVGGMQLDTVEMPICARARLGHSPVDARLSYSLARGCVKLLNGELADVELCGQASDGKPSGVHFVLANGTSHAWVTSDLSSPDSSSTLKLCGMPFSSQLVNYNAGIAIGLFLLMHADEYPDFTSAVSRAVRAWNTNNETAKAQSLALMADEMAVCLEDMLGNKDPLSIQAILMDREKPDVLDRIFNGGELLKSAFTNEEDLKIFTGDLGKPANTVTVTPNANQFLGDLPLKLSDCILRGKHVLLTGPTATGKTLAVEEACLRLNAPLIVVRGSEGLEDRDLIGSTTLTAEQTKEGQIASKTVFTYGPIPEAMILGREQHQKHLHEIENAKQENRSPVQVPPAVLLVDEINRLQLRFQNFLVSAMNVRKATRDYYVRIPDNNEEITCPDSFLVIIAARNVGAAFAGTNAMDLALERRFYKKIDVNYLPSESEALLVQNRTGLDPKLAQVLVKVASDTRYQLSQLKAPLDTDSILKWAEELAYLECRGTEITDQVLMETARDIVFNIILERSERGGFDSAGEAILTDNISENWRDVISSKSTI